MKNTLIFVALISSHRYFIWGDVKNSIMAFFAFCFCASALYILNDLLDIESDRTHPSKHKRPFASGALPIYFGFSLMAIFAFASICVCASLPYDFTIIVFAYAAITMGYSFLFKRIPFIDVAILAGLYYMRIFGTFSGFGFVNFVMSATILAAIYSISKKFFGSRAAYGAAIIYAATYSNWFAPIGYFSEIPFVFFVVLALAFALVPQAKWANYILAGVLIAVGNWIRPLALAYFLGIILFVISKREYAITRIVAFLASTLTTIVAIGFWTKSNCGIFAFQSATSGINLAGSANKYANGAVGFGFANDDFYISRTPENWAKIDFAQKDAHLRKTAKEWIFQNPVKYISQIPLKSALLLGFDTWSERFEKGSGLSSVKAKIESDKTFALKYYILLFLKSLVYYAAMILFALYIFMNYKKILSPQNIIIVIPFLVLAFTYPFMVTDRYHFPMMPIVWIFAGAELVKIAFKRTEKNTLGNGYVNAAKIS